MKAPLCPYDEHDQLVALSVEWVVCESTEVVFEATAAQARSRNPGSSDRHQQLATGQSTNIETHAHVYSTIDLTSPLPHMDNKAVNTKPQ